MVIDFSDGKSVVYKPRSTSLEAGFQRYLEFFNSAQPDLCLRLMRVIDKGPYGWVEFVAFSEHTNESESDSYYFKLGFLASILFSINGVDIFFENLVSCGIDPVIIDLETMFHTSIDSDKERSPAKALQVLLHQSILGIGILPQPSKGASESDLFDVSVMGAKKNAQAPYKVTGVENFGRSDMRITDVAGWIPENKSAPENAFSYRRKAQHLFEGLRAGLECVMQHREPLASDDGVIDQCFAGSKRRLIVRDTKVYGALQKDETHPDLLRDQVDREWHWDNLWSDLKDRPSLSLFCRSELNQLKRGDIPYFSGEIDSLQVSGGDGSIIDLSNIIGESPMRKAKSKILHLTEYSIATETRMAATALGLDHLSGITQPIFDLKIGPMDNAIAIARYIISRTKDTPNSPWCDTSINPAPKAIGVDSVSVIPSDPFLYDGMSGVALFLHDLGYATGDRTVIKDAMGIAESIFLELGGAHNYPASGYVGLSSIIYVMNRCIQKEGSPFSSFDQKLPSLIEEIAEISRKETTVDFLVGTAGIASALLPYVRRTENPTATAILNSSLKSLLDTGAQLSDADDPVDGMDYVRGFSHGISGIALTLYRLGEFFDRQDAVEVATSIILNEYRLVKGGQWTDSHTFDGSPLVGWCHGSAGIALALASMPKILSCSGDAKEYLGLAVSHTMERGMSDSKCLCHGTAGNLLCLSDFGPGRRPIKRLMERFDADLLTSGFSSLGAAQTMGIGLMTGLTGAGYYLLRRANPGIDHGFLTLA
jgi:type 2 lantibiotic biosynthesis protein LanM